MPGRLSGYVAGMEAVVRRLASVSLECSPALDVVAVYGRKRLTLLYVDPPYLGTVQNESAHRIATKEFEVCW